MPIVRLSETGRACSGSSMTLILTVAAAATWSDVTDAKRLFSEYAASLPVDLGYQDFGSELAALPGGYAPPLGAMLIARDERRRAVGCVAIRPLPVDGACEMKRLYVVPGARGRGLGRMLVERAVEAARSMGHREMRLDTLPTMLAAMDLYERLGFHCIEAYYSPTPPGTRFMALSL